MAELIKMPFGIRTLVQCGCQMGCTGSRRVRIATSWRIRLNHPCVAAMWPYIKSLWPLLCCSFGQGSSLLWTDALRPFC